MEKLQEKGWQWHDWNPRIGGLGRCFLNFCKGPFSDSRFYVGFRGCNRKKIAVFICHSTFGIKTLDRVTRQESFFSLGTIFGALGWWVTLDLPPQESELAIEVFQLPAIWTLDFIGSGRFIV